MIMLISYRSGRSHKAKAARDQLMISQLVELNTHNGHSRKVYHICKCPWHCSENGPFELVMFFYVHPLLVKKLEWFVWNN